MGCGYAPRSLTRGQAAIGADGGTSSPLAGGTGDRLVAFELETAAFCARYGTPCALEFLLLRLDRALLVVLANRREGHGGGESQGTERGGKSRLVVVESRSARADGAGQLETAGRPMHGKRVRDKTRSFLNAHLKYPFPPSRGSPHPSANLGPRLPKFGSASHTGARLRLRPAARGSPRRRSPTRRRRLQIPRRCMPQPSASIMGRQGQVC